MECRRRNHEIKRVSPGVPFLKGHVLDLNVWILSAILTRTRGKCFSDVQTQHGITTFGEGNRRLSRPAANLKYSPALRDARDGNDILY